jgi:hypothetical protein
MFLTYTHYGRLEVIRQQVATLAEASAAWCKYRDQMGKEFGVGASSLGEAEIVVGSNKKIARVSYNGRVWPIEPWHVGMKPLCEAQS